MKELALFAMLLIAINADCWKRRKLFRCRNVSNWRKPCGKVSLAKAMNRRSLPHRPTNSTGGWRSIGAIPRAAFLGNRSKWNWIKSTDAPSEPARSFPVEDRLANAIRELARWLRCEIKVWRESMARSGQKNSAPLCAESNSGSARSEVIKLIRHRLHEPLGPTLLVLQLLLREESLSPQGVALIRMLQRSIKEEVRAIQELLTIIERFIQEPVQADSRTEQRLEESSQSGLS